jgi:uncharacterized protein with PQ loop repeat
MIEKYMILVAFGSITSWIPQITRMVQTKSTDDFSLWTTGILAWVNLSFLVQAILIDDLPFMLMQGITCFMLGLFTFLVLRYRTWNDG